MRMVVRIKERKGHVSLIRLIFQPIPCTQEYQILSMYHSQVNQSMHSPQGVDTPLQLHVTKSFKLFLKSSSKSSLKFEIKEGWKGD